MLDLVNKLQEMVESDKPTVIGGDLNICVLSQPKNHVTTNLKELGFQQIVTQATHIDGGVIDHLYITEGGSTKLDWILEYVPKYYSDHDGLCLSIRESCAAE